MRRTRGWYGCSCALLVSLLVLIVSAHAQRARPPAYTLDQLTRHAQYIFSGVVTNIERVPATAPHAVESVRVTFRVTHGIRGVRAGEVLNIHEWAGLWTSADRYRVGQQVVLFLHPRSKLGLTSPVAGDYGRFLLDTRNQVQVGESRAEELFRSDALGGKRRGSGRMRWQVPYREFAERVQTLNRLYRAE